MANTPIYTRVLGSGRPPTPERQALSSAVTPAVRVRLKQMPRTQPASQPTAVPTVPATNIPKT